MNYRYLFAPALLAALWFAPALAATTSTPTSLVSTAYTDLGAGPIYLAADGAGVVYLIGDSQPAASQDGIALQQGAGSIPLQTTSHVWAKLVGPGPASAIVSSGSGITGFGSVAQSGSTGADYSANKPTLPNVGANFAASGPYASYVLIATAAASPSRLSIDVENTSGAQIAIVLDDGAASSGSAPNNASVFALSAGSGAGAQGGSWVSQVERGRVQVYAPASTAQVAVRTN